MLKGRRKLLTLAYWGWGIGLFIAFTLIYFPLAQILRTTLMPIGLDLEFEDAHLSFPPGVTLTEARIALPSSSPTFRLNAPWITVRPVLTKFFEGEMAVAIEADLFDGRGQLILTQEKGQLVAMWFDFSGVDLGKLSQVAGIGAPLSGHMSAHGNLIVDRNGMVAGPGEISFQGRDVLFRLGTGIFSILFKRLSGNVSLNPGLMTIKSINGDGPELALALQGQIHLARDITLSTINLTCRLNPTPLGRERLGVLMRLLPHSPDTRPYNIRGPLLMPSIT